MIITIADVDAYASVLEAVSDGVPLADLDAGYRWAAERYAKVATHPWPPTPDCLDRFWDREWARRKDRRPSQPITVDPAAGSRAW